MRFFWTFYSSKNTEKNITLFNTNILQVFNTDNNKNAPGAPNQHIRMISKRSLQTEVMPDENSDFYQIFNCNNIDQYFCFIVFLIK